MYTWSGRGRVTDDQRRTALVSGRGEVGEAAQPESVLGGAGGDLGFVIVGQVHDRVEPGCDAADLESRHVAGEHRHELVAAAPVGEAHAAYVLVEPSGSRSGRRAWGSSSTLARDATCSLGLHDFVEERLGHDEPTEP